MERNNSAITAKQVTAGYNGMQVLFDVTLSITTGKVHSIIGHNASGKSTLLRVLSGLHKPSSGHIVIRGNNVDHTPLQFLNYGVAFVPQSQNVFPSLTVTDNLAINSNKAKPDAKRLREEVLSFFPQLKKKLNVQAKMLSGGERQMVAIGSALMCRPQILLLDEPSLGLAPGISSVLFDSLLKLSEERNMTIVIAEQRVRDVLQISSTTNVLRRGLVTYNGASSTLNDDKLLRDVFL